MPETKTKCWNCGGTSIDYKYDEHGHRYGECSKCKASITDLPKLGQSVLKAPDPQDPQGSQTPRPVRRKKQ